MNFEGSGKLCKPARVGYSVTIWVIANVVHYKRNTGRIIESQLPFCQVFFVFVIPFREPVHMFIFVCTYIYIYIRCIYIIIIDVGYIRIYIYLYIHNYIIII